MITLAHLDPAALRRQAQNHLQDADGFHRIATDHEHRASLLQRMADDVDRARADAAATAPTPGPATGGIFLPTASPAAVDSAQDA